MLDQNKVTALLQKGSLSYEIQCVESIDSTNAQLRRQAMDGEAVRSCGCMVCAAEHQTSGRGRRGRRWESPSGKNLYFSLLLFPEFAQEKASMLTLVAALAVTEAICALGIEAKIKWPNDVVADGAKLCGILTELGWVPDGRYFVIIGIGINVNQEAFAEEIRQTATSVFLQTGQQQDRESLLAFILEKFALRYEQFACQQDLSGMRDEYESLLANCGQRVKVLDPKGDWEGTALGINDLGELLVCRENGQVEAVYAGEVSVRGIYGYV